METKTLSIFTLDQDHSKALKQDTQIVLTLTSADERLAALQKPLVWKVLNFRANESSEQEKHIHLSTYSRRISTARVVDDKFVFPDQDSLGLGPDQYAVLSSELQWLTYRLFNTPAGQTFVINNDNHPQQFTIGVRSANNAFEPLILSQEVRSREGILVQKPTMLQAYATSGCIAGQVFEPTEPGLLSEGGTPKPINITSPSVGSSIRWHIYTGDNNQVILDRLHDNRSANVIYPPPISADVVMEFGSPMLTPLPDILSLPASPASLGSPGFLRSLRTPPETPALELPFSPILLRPPGFLSPEIEAPEFDMLSYITSPVTRPSPAFLSPIAIGTFSYNTFPSTTGANSAHPHGDNDFQGNPDL